MNHQGRTKRAERFAGLLGYCLITGLFFAAVQRCAAAGAFDPHSYPFGGSDKRQSVGFRSYARPSGGLEFAGFLQRSAFSPSSVYTVNSTLDTTDAAPGDNLCDDGMGRCTLRAAIEESNARPGADVINFAIGTGPQTIFAASDLPPVTDPVIVDGTTQPGFAGAPIIEVAGVSSAFAFDVTAGRTTIRGLILNRWDTAIQFDVAGNNVVEGCYIGTDRNGSIASPNQDGIIVRSDDNRISAWPEM